jgi:hypothetical protein
MISPLSGVMSSIQTIIAAIPAMIDMVAIIRITIFLFGLNIIGERFSSTN